MRNLERPDQKEAAQQFLGEGTLASETSPDGEVQSQPLYRQILGVLREKIISGVYPDGSVLPSEHQLQNLFGVSRITARRALDELAASGFARRQRGVGTLVTFAMPISSPVQLDGLMENLLATSVETDVKVLAFEYIPAPPHVADAMDLKPLERVQRAVRIRTTQGHPFSYVVTYVPEDVGLSFRQSDLEHATMISLIERSGVEIDCAHQTATAVLADHTLAGALSVDVGAPILKVSRVVRDTEGRVVEFIHVHYRPDLYQLSFTLSRKSGTDGNSWTSGAQR